MRGLGVLFLGVVLVLQPRVLQAAPQADGSAEAGGAAVLLQFHRSTNSTPLVWTGPAFAFLLPPASYTDLRIDQYHFVPNVGKVATSVDFTNSGGSFAAGRGMVGMSDLRRGAWKLDVNLGDGPLDIYNLDFQLESLYKPFAGLRGAQVIASTGRTTFAAFGGQTTAVNGFFADAVLVGHQSLVGARVVLNPTARLELGTSLLHTAATRSTVLPLPRSTSAVTADAIYRWTPQLRLMGEVSVAAYSGSTQSARPSGHDISFVAGSRFTSENRHAEVSYLRLTPNYVPLSSFTLGDREGVYASGNARVATGVMVYGAFSRFHNNVLRSAARPVFTIDSGFIGARYQLAPGSYLGARVSGGGVESSGTGTDLRSGRNRSLYLDFSSQIGMWRVLGRASEIRSTEITAASRESVSRRAEVELRRIWRNGSSAWAAIGRLDERGLEQDGSRSSLTGNAGLTLTIGKKLSVYADAAWNQGLADLKTSSVDNYSVAAGLTWALPRDTDLSVYGRYARDSSTLSVFDALTIGPGAIDDLGAFLQTLQRNTYQVTVRLRKSFKWGRRPVSRDAAGGLSGMPARVEVGTIEGVVFNDLNGSGLRDVDERGVANVTVILDGQLKEPVEADGRYSFRNVPIGAHTVELELTTVPASWDVGPRSRASVSVERRAMVPVEFPLIPLGKLSGKVVVIDRPDPTIRWVATAERKGDRPGANIIVLLNGTYKVTMSDADGEFGFASLPPGEYRVSVDESSLPEFSAVLTEPVQKVTLTPGGRVSDLSIVIGASPRPVRRIVVPPQRVPDPGKGPGPGKGPAFP